MAWFLLALKVRWYKSAVVECSRIQHDCLNHRQINTPLDQMQVYGIEFTSAGVGSEL